MIFKKYNYLFFVSFILLKLVYVSENYIYSGIFLLFVLISSYLSSNNFQRKIENHDFVFIARVDSRKRSHILRNTFSILLLITGILGIYFKEKFKINVSFVRVLYTLIGSFGLDYFIKQFFLEEGKEVAIKFSPERLRVKNDTIVKDFYSLEGYTVTKNDISLSKEGKSFVIEHIELNEAEISTLKNKLESFVQLSQKRENKVDA